VGDKQGHPFRGNQYGAARGGSGAGRGVAGRSDWGVKEEHVRAGYAVDDEPEGRLPSVSWGARDLEDSAKTVTEESVRKDYGAHPRDDVYRAWIPTGDVPAPSFKGDLEIARQYAEEVGSTEEEGGYDWSEMAGRDRGMPPVKLRVGEGGRLEIIDGNHRIKFWGDRGYAAVPAWVIDTRTRTKRARKVD